MACFLLATRFSSPTEVHCPSSGPNHNPETGDWQAPRKNYIPCASQRMSRARWRLRLLTEAREQSQLQLLKCLYGGRLRLDTLSGPRRLLMIGRWPGNLEKLPWKMASLSVAKSLLSQRHGDGRRRQTAERGKCLRRSQLAAAAGSERLLQFHPAETCQPTMRMLQVVVQGPQRR